MKKSIGSLTRETMCNADPFARRADRFFRHAQSLFRELLIWEEGQIKAEGDWLVAQVLREMKRRAEKEIIASALRELAAR